MTFLQDAKFNCHRARHDAIDVATSKIAVTLELMSNKLGPEAVIKAYPSFSGFWVQLNATKEKIVESRANRENREVLYQQIENNEFDSLVREFRNVQSAEPIMKAIAKRDKIAKWSGYAFGIIGIIIALASLIIQLTSRSPS